LYVHGKEDLSRSRCQLNFRSDSGTPHWSELGHAWCWHLLRTLIMYTMAAELQ